MAEGNARPMLGLGRRIATGLGLGVLAVAVVCYAPLWVLALVVAGLAALGMWEFNRLVLPERRRAEEYTGLACAALLPLAALAGGGGLVGALGLTPLAVACAAWASQDELPAILDRVVKRGWGVLYTSGALSTFLVLATRENGRALVFFAVAVVVAADTGAYFTGHLLGRRQLAPRLSPGKTREGLLGGLALAGLVGGVLAKATLPDTPVGAGVALGLALALVSVAGDLLESSLKRSTGAKDSGAVLPGHGGMLDRFDGIITAGPVLLLIRDICW